MSDRPRRFSLLRVLFGVALLSAVGWLVLMHVGEPSEGQGVITSWAIAVRAGTPVSAEVGGAEAPALTEAVRRSVGTSVSNFQSQAGTSCFWVTLNGPSGETELRVVLAEQPGGLHVTAASLGRDCDCPDDASERCHLE